MNESRASQKQLKMNQMSDKKSETPKTQLKVVPFENELDHFDAVNDLNDQFPGIEAYVHKGDFNTREVRSRFDPLLKLILVDDGYDSEWKFVRGGNVNWGKSAVDAMNSFLAGE
jgi:hypothetical protein